MHPAPASWPPAPAPRRRLPLWAKVVVTVVVVAVVGSVLFVAAVIVSFSGGFDDVLDVRKPSEDSTRVVAARRKGIAAVEAEHERVVSVYTGMGAVDTGVRVAGDACSEGQHNWKVDDDYDLDCHASASAVVAVDRASLGSREASLRAVLEEAGWQPAEPAGYTDVRALWTLGGTLTERRAGTLSVSVLHLDDAGRSLDAYDLQGTPGYSGARPQVTRGGAAYEPAGLRSEYPGKELVLLGTSTRYFYD